jgi:hypothetical protein
MLGIDGALDRAGDVGKGILLILVASMIRYAIGYELSFQIAKGPRAGSTRAQTDAQGPRPLAVPPEPIAEARSDSDR